MHLNNLKEYCEGKIDNYHKCRMMLWIFFNAGELIVIYSEKVINTKLNQSKCHWHQSNTKW